MILAGLTAKEATKKLLNNNGFIRKVINNL